MGATSRVRIEIRKIAASFLLAMKAILMLSPFVAAMGNENSRHREERSDLHLFLSPKNADKLPRNAGHTLMILGSAATDATHMKQLQDRQGGSGAVFP